MSTKNLRTRFTTWAAPCIAAAVLYFAGMPSYRQGEPFSAARRAEDFSMKVGGRQARLSEFRGKIVVLNFWASYCGSCVQELPDLDQLQERIRSRGGVVLAVSIDDNCASYEDFLRMHPVRFQTTCEPTKKVSLEYGTVMIPETYLIDREGLIARKIIGPQQWASAQMTNYFDDLLARN